MRHRILSILAASGVLLAAVGCEVGNPTETELLANVWADVEATTVIDTVYDYSQADAEPDTDQTDDDHGDRYLTVFRSKKATGIRPAILYVHSGGFVKGSRNEIKTPEPVVGSAYGIGAALYAQVRDDRHWVVISVDYRFGPYPQGLDDVNQALAWVKAHAATLQIDPSQIVIGGSSAGGNLASMVGLQPSGAEVVAGVVNLDGPNHLASVTGADNIQVLIDDYLGCDVPPTGSGTVPCTPGAVDAASPITYLDSSDPPVYLACGALGTNDNTSEYIGSMCPDHQAMHEQSEVVSGNGVRAWLDVIDDSTHFTIDQTINFRVLEEFLDGAIQPN